MDAGLVVSSEADLVVARRPLVAQVSLRALQRAGTRVGKHLGEM